MKLKDILKEIGEPNQYKSPEALAKQSQQKEKALRDYNALKRQEQDILSQIQKLTEELRQTKIRISEIEQDYMNNTDLEDFDF